MLINNQLQNRNIFKIHKYLQIHKDTLQHLKKLLIIQIINNNFNLPLQSLINNLITRKANIKILKTITTILMETVHLYLFKI